MWPVAVTVVSLAAIGVGGFLYFTKLETSAPTKVAASSSVPGPRQRLSPRPRRRRLYRPLLQRRLPPHRATPAAIAFVPSGRVVGEICRGQHPLYQRQARASLATDYVPAADFKAFALNVGGLQRFRHRAAERGGGRNRPRWISARSAPSRQSPRKCELYAVGNTVVYTHGRPPMPPLPWIRHDPRPSGRSMPKQCRWHREPDKVRLENVYAPAAKNKALAIGPGGRFFFPTSPDSVEEAARRALESCGAVAGAPCMIVALDDVFVVPIPALRRVTGFFQASANTRIAAMRATTSRASSRMRRVGWNAVAVGFAGRSGSGVEGNDRTDRDQMPRSPIASSATAICHVIAIGPFAVGPT